MSDLLFSSVSERGASSHISADNVSDWVLCEGTDQTKNLRLEKNLFYVPRLVVTPIHLAYSGSALESTWLYGNPLRIVRSLHDREVACSASDLQGLNFESCVWRAVSSHSSHHPQEVLLAQFSLYVHKSGLKPDSFHFIFSTYIQCLCISVPVFSYKLRYIVCFGLVEMAISTNPKPTIYRNL